MAWYKTGTVRVTAGSVTVTGTGTDFVTFSRVGDGFRGPDGKWYEVTNIASGTVLSIFPAYESATVAAGTYMLAPLQGYPQRAADRLNAIVSQYGETLDNLADKNLVLSVAGVKANLLNDVPAASLLAALGAAKSGANSDITSLTGLTTALSVAQGGTGAKTAPLARAALGVIFSENALSIAMGSTLRVGDIGLGVSACPAITNANTQLTEGRFSTLGASNLPSEVAANQAGVLLVTPFSSQWVSQQYTLLASFPRTWLRVFVSGTTWTDWIESTVRSSRNVALPSANADTLTVEGSFFTTGTWTGSPLTGTQGGNQGTLISTVWDNGATYAQHVFTPITPTGPRRYRQKVAGTWQAWIPIIDATTATQDPALNTGGLMSSSVVSGFVVSKYANGALNILGSLGTTATLAANSSTTLDFTIPSGLNSQATSSPVVTCVPTNSFDVYGVTVAYAATLSTIRVIVRNGPVAQTFALILNLWGRWR